MISINQAVTSADHCEIVVNPLVRRHAGGTVRIHAVWRCRLARQFLPGRLVAHILSTSSIWPPPGL